MQVFSPCHIEHAFDYTNLSMMYQELDLAFDALDEELKETHQSQYSYFL